MMKKITLIVIMPFIALVMTACDSDTKTKSYSLDSGTYGFEKAIITNILTNEVTESTFDEILGSEEYREWHWMFSFTVGITENTEYIYTGDNRCYVLSESLAYELTSDNTLQLHFPRFEGYDYGVYDVLIIFEEQKVYG